MRMLVVAPVIASCEFNVFFVHRLLHVGWNKVPVSKDSSIVLEFSGVEIGAEKQTFRRWG
jgi:hypothetical protein